MNKLVQSAFKKGIITTLGLILLVTAAWAQSGQETDHDADYYESYPSDIVLRTYLSQKYTTLELKKGNDPPRLRYRPNTNLNAGIGFTYRRLTLNLAYGFGFINQDKEKGENKKLDLQARFYGRKWAIDLFGQFYKGYFVYPKGRGNTDPNNYYIRPDLKVNLGGISIYRILNHQRFTLRPVFMQDEWQKKSAGSFLVGAEIYYGNFSGDSALVPPELNGFYDRRSIRNVWLLKIGPGVGYAYTQVLPLHLFLSGSFTVNANVGLVHEAGTGETTNHVAVNANMLYRLGAGFNNGNWSVTASWINSRNGSKGALSGNGYVLNTGSLRLVLAKRFEPGAGLKRTLKPLDNILKRL